MYKFLIIFLIFFSKNIYSAEWSNYQELSNSKLTVKIDMSLESLIGTISPSAWISKANLEGKPAFSILMENFSNSGFLYIDHTKFPPAWIIRGSGNDKKFIKKNTAWLLNIDESQSPLKSLRKSNIKRYRDAEDNVVPYVKFEFDGMGCMVFKKGYYTQESGYVTSANDDETMFALYCSYEQTSLNIEDIETIIDGIQVSIRR